MVQAASDIFLGWSEGKEEDRYYYWRQLRYSKGSPVVDEIIRPGLKNYAECAWTLAVG